MNKIWKENKGFIITAIVLAFLLFNMNARTFVMQQLFKIGLFAPDIDQNKKLDAVNTDISFKKVDGTIVSLSELKGKVVFLNFWATWCPPCVAEMPSIQKLYEQTNNDIEFIMLDVDHQEERSLNFLKKHNYTFPLFFPASAIPESIFDGTLPTTLVIDKQGNIVYRHKGIADYSNKKFISNMLELVNQ